jgi:uncharacterized membrane protein
LDIAQTAFFIIFPYALIKITGASKKLGFISPILLSYIVGIILGNLKFLPINTDLAMTVSEISIPIAIPLILFSTDFKKWLGLAKKTVKSFLLMILSAMIASTAGALLLSGTVEEADKLSGMLVGLYTGGTPNLMAIGMGLDIKEETLVLANASDVVIGGAYFLFLLFAAKKLFRKFLPAFKGDGEPAGAENGQNGKMSFKVVYAVLLSILFVAAAAGISYLITRGIDVAVVMLVITTLGIGASFINKVRNIKGTYEAGQYCILIFSLALGTNVNFAEMITSGSSVFIYTLVVMTLSIVVHLIFSKIFAIDVDTSIITSTAGIYGPAFIPPVADAIGNREVIISGLTCGLVGYAVGNYFGFALAGLLNLLGLV